MENKKLTTSLVASLLIATNLYSNELSSVTVTSATKSEQSIKDVTSNVEVITKEEIEERHFTTITELLNTISGISFTSNGGIGQTSSIKLRGFDPKRVLVLVDGVRYNDVTGLNGAQFENIMIEDIKKVEVIKGAQSGIWGADASAGVINIITNDIKDGFHGSINTEYGSYDTKKYGLNLSYANKDYYLNGFYNKLDTDGFSAYTPRDENVDDYEDDAYENETYGVKAGFNFDDSNKIDLNYRVSNSKTEYDDFGADSSTNYSTSKTNVARVNYENINSITTSNIYYNRTDFDRKNYDSFPSEFKGSVDEVGINTNIKYLDDNSFLILGTDYKKFKEDDTITQNYKNNGFFITNSNRFDNTVFTQSLRYDKYDSFNNKTTGKIGVKHNFTKDLFVSTNYGTAFNTPTLYQLYNGFVGNEDLNPETTKSFDISLGFKDLKVVYFHNKIKDLIDYYDPDGFMGPLSGKFYNLDGESTIKGFEISYSKDILDDTLLSLNYTRLSAENNDGEDLANRANSIFKFGVDYYGFNKFHINLNGEYIGKRYSGANNTGTQTGKYTLWNSVVNYEINRKTNVYLKLDNIFDKDYQTVDGYATAGRSAYIGVNYKF